MASYKHSDEPAPKRANRRGWMRYVLFALIGLSLSASRCPPNEMQLAMIVVGPGALSNAGPPATYRLTIGAGAKPANFSWTPGTPVTIQDDNGVVLVNITGVSLPAGVNGQNLTFTLGCSGGAVSGSAGVSTKGRLPSTIAVVYAGNRYDGKAGYQGNELNVACTLP